MKNKYIVVPYVIDQAESTKAGVTVITDSEAKIVEANNSVEAAVAHRPRKTTFWHIRKMQN